MATETNLGTVHVFPSEASFTANSASVGASDLALVKYPEMDFVVESYRNGTEWYRKYKSGWLEQGGWSASNIVTLLTPMADTNYTVTTEPYDGTTWDPKETNVHSLTTTSFTVGTQEGSFRKIMWRVSGQGA